jgi:predicted HTH domain antitoxin
MIEEASMNAVLQLPDDIDLTPSELALTLAARLYEQGRLSAGQAAQLAGLSKRGFVELLGSQEVALFNYPAKDLAQDIERA